MAKITEMYALIKTHDGGEEELLMLKNRLSVVEKEMQEKRWSSIQNCGVDRTDLSVVTFVRKDV